MPSGLRKLGFSKFQKKEEPEAREQPPREFDHGTVWHREKMPKKRAKLDKDLEDTIKATTRNEENEKAEDKMKKRTLKR